MAMSLNHICDWIRSASPAGRLVSDSRRVKAGESFVIPAGTVHDAINTGKGPMKLVGVYVVDKGKPLATPAK